MTPHDLIAAFEDLADAPDGVKRLRELVLQLAVRGKLVPQDPSDEPASALVQRLSSGTAKAGATPIFDLPTGWTWARFDKVAEIASNLVDPSDHLDCPHVAPDSIEKGTGRLLSYRTIREDKVSSGKHLFFAGQILYSKIRPNLSKVVRVDFGGLCSADMYPINPRIDRRYLHQYMLSRPFLDQVTAEDNRLAMPKVNQSQLSTVRVSVPPLAEQHRIVARVDELMGLLDRLEAARTTRDEVRRAARDAALAALRDAEDSEAVEAAWGRIDREMDTLFTDPEDVGPLRQVVLQVAVTGWLVPQDPTDRPAIESVRRSETELSGLPGVRGRQATDARIPGDAALSVGPAYPKYLPPGWAEVPLSRVSRLESGHTPDRDITEYWGGPFKWVGIQDARRNRGGVILETEKTLTQAGIDNSAARLLPEGTVCLSRTASIGYTTILGEAMCTSQDFVNFVCTSALEPRYLQIVLEAEYTALRRFAKGAVHLTIYFPEVKALHLLLPPLAEQLRIVAKVEALMALYDDFQSRLTAARDLQAQFAAAAVHHLDV